MRAVLIMLCVAGCARIWDPDGYRGEGVDVGVADAGADADIGIDGGDGDPDAGIEDAGEDVLGDAGPDVPDARDAGCVLTDTDPLELREDLFNAKITHTGSGPAIRVAAPGIRITNVDITISGASGSGIVIEPDANGVMINNVRIQRVAAGSQPNLFAIDIQGPGAGFNDDAIIDNVEIRGMEGIRLSRVSSARLTRIRIIEPEGFGAVDHTTTRHYGVLFEETVSCRLTDFAVTGAGATPEVTHALRFTESERLTVSNGFVSARSARYPVSAFGRRNSSPRNQLSNVVLTNNPRGVELSVTSHWSLSDVQVARIEGCEMMDYAFGHFGLGSDMVSCTNCIWSGCREVTPTLGQLMALEAGVLTPVPSPLLFCFPVMF